MSCNCREKTTIIQCTECGKMQTINHSKTDNPIEFAKRRGRKCACGGSTFRVGGQN